MSAKESTGGSAVPGGGPNRRLTIWIVVAAIVVVLLVAGGLIAAGIGGAAQKHAQPIASMSPGPAATNRPVQDPTSGATEAPSPTDDPSFGQPVAQTVPKDHSADFGDAVTARISALTPVTATGTQPGEVSGPAVQVDLELTNGTPAEISLATVDVNAYYGSDRKPATPIVSKSGSSGFTGTLAAGATAKGRYVFSVPEDQQNSVVITVSKSAGAPIVVVQ